MIAIRQRGVWVRKRMHRRFKKAMLLSGVCSLYLIFWAVFFYPANLTSLIVPTAILMAMSIVVMLFNRPSRWCRRWNEDHPQMGQYLVTLD